MNEQNVIRKWFKLSKEAGVFSFELVYYFDEEAYSMIHFQMYVANKKKEGGKLYDRIRHWKYIVQNLKPEDQDEMTKVFEERMKK
jgi:hypothetical protein